MRIALITASVLGLLGVASSAATASTITRTYPLVRTGVEYLYGAVVYDPEDGTDPIYLAGFPVTDTHIKIGYAPAAGEDINLFHVEMLVPTDSANPFLSVTGSDLTQDAPGHYIYDLTTDTYNGTIYAGRFSVTTYSQDADGNPISTGGVWDDGSGISLIVETPEPVSAAAVVGGLSLLARRRR